MKTSAQPPFAHRSGPGRLLAPVAWCLAALALAAGVRADQAMTLASGRAVTLSVTAEGTQPFTYQWRKDGVDLAGATGGTYAIASFGSAHAGVYTVRVGNSAGTTLSDAATLNLEAVVAPLITAQPLSQTVLAGGSVTFTAAAGGSNPLSYRWRRNGVDLANGGNVSGATTATLSLANVSSADAATYTLVVTNGGGTAVSSGATLTVTQASAPPPPSEPVATSPSFTTQPISQSAIAGATVLLSAQATGSPSPSYQWRRNGVNLVDGGNVAGSTTGTLTLAGVTTTDTGTYILVASNSAGTAMSQVAELTVAAASAPPPAPPPSETPSSNPPPVVVSPAPAPAPQPEQPAGPGPSSPSPLLFPIAVAVGGGEIFVADAGFDQLFRIAGNGSLHVLAGAAGQVGSDDGTGTGARFNDPSGLAVSSDGRLIVADRANALIRAVDSAGRVTRVAGSAQYRGAEDGPAASATFSSPVGVARTVAGVVYVADAMMHTIRRIGLTGDVTTLAGRAGTPGDADGSGADARFNQPTGLAVDGAGALYVADTGNNLIRRVTADGVVSTVAGIFGVSGSRDGLAGEALFNQPVGLALDVHGNLYVADTGNSTIRKITPQGVVSTFAGLSGVSGLRDGQGGDAWLSQPRSLAVDASGTLYVADTGNARIRRISPSGEVSTLSLGDALLPPSADTTPPPPAPSAPAPSPAPSSGGSGGGGGGGGGSTGAVVALALATLFTLRMRRLCSR